LAKRKRRTPNILFLFTDQHKASVMGCAGHPLVKTPNLDRLANEGVRFTRAYCTDGILRTVTHVDLHRLAPQNDGSDLQ